jgi:hypothetical protein
MFGPIVKQRKRMTRLLSIFESQIKVYDEHFNNDYYQMSYIIHICPFTGNITVEATMTIWNRHYFFNNIETTFDFMSSLKSFCSYFSMQQVRIVRQLKKPANPPPNIEERIAYGIYEKTIN